MAGFLQFELMERKKRDGGDRRQNPDQWNITLSDDTDEGGGQYEQDEVEDVKNVKTGGVGELLGCQRPL